MQQTRLTRLTTHLTRNHIPGWRLLHLTSLTRLWVHIWWHRKHTGHRYNQRLTAGHNNAVMHQQGISTPPSR